MEPWNFEGEEYLQKVAIAHTHSTWHTAHDAWHMNTAHDKWHTEVKRYSEKGGEERQEGGGDRGERQALTEERDRH